MKRMILPLAIVALVLVFSCSSTKKVLSPEEREEKISSLMNDGYSEEEAGILAMTKQERLEYLCPYYDIPVDKKEYEYTDKRYRSAIYSFVVGDFDASVENRSDLKTIVVNHCDIVSFFNTVGSRSTADRKKVFYYSEYMSAEELFIRQVLAVRKVEEIHRRLHDEGVVVDGMTEYQKAYAISEWLWNNIGQKQSRGKAVRIEVDSAYNCLYGLTSDCAARAGAYVMLLHREGIKAQSWHTHRSGASERNMHVMTRAILDGKEYYIDWANKFRGIRTHEEWLVWDPSNEANIIVEDDAIRLF